MHSVSAVFWPFNVSVSKKNKDSKNCITEILRSWIFFKIQHIKLSGRLALWSLYSHLSLQKEVWVLHNNQMEKVHKASVKIQIYKYIYELNIYRHPSHTIFDSFCLLTKMAFADVGEEAQIELMILLSCCW